MTVDLLGGKKNCTLSVSVTEHTHELFEVCAMADGTDISNKLNAIIIKYLNERVAMANLITPVIKRQLNNK
jgi:hypothetical protein